MKKVKIKMGKEDDILFRHGRDVGRDILFFIFLIFASFSDLRKSDRRFSSGLKEKLIYAMRATRGHQKVGVSTNSVR